MTEKKPHEGTAEEEKVVVLDKYLEWARRNTEVIDEYLKEEDQWQLTGNQ